jgi:hypothetical protein
MSKLNKIKRQRMSSHSSKHEDKHSDGKGNHKDTDNHNGARQYGFSFREVVAGRVMVTIHDLPSSVIGQMLGYLEVQVSDEDWLCDVFPNRTWAREWMINAVSIEIFVSRPCLFPIHFKWFRRISNVSIRIDQPNTNNLAVVHGMMHEIANRTSPKLSIKRLQIMLCNEPKSWQGESERYTSLILSLFPRVKHFRVCGGKMSGWLVKCRRCKHL